MGESKGSTRKSGAKKGAQKYQNTFAFVHNKGSKTTKKILESPVDGLCTRCHDQILWRKKYRKYKPLSVAAKCVNCDQRNITKAYHVLCDDCAGQKKVCAKCMENKEIVPPESEALSTQILKDQELERKLDAMRERERRSYKRKLERGDILPEDVPEPSKNDFSDFDSDFDSESDSEDSN
ncbi:hypothetical protein BB559_002562 [Furculomyces boomerangus]|uniref:Uncharacterized protein n=1 Tax=Furculomyces boomerangus TaxID=61424 RepID=A0A2T9YU86_9FUNG|nr:hypothetical protein BB559_002562 [Furculomyces boomerangus]